MPAVVNIGVGPTVGTVMRPGLDTPAPVSVGVALQLEGWVSGKTLHSRKVMRRVPKRYRSMVRGMDDLHVVPLPAMLVPDQVLAFPVRKDPSANAVRAVGWVPVSLYLAHRVRPSHMTVALGPRLGWLQISSDQQDPDNLLWMGIDVNPEWQSAMTQRVGAAAGGHVGPGLALGRSAAAGSGVWADAYLRLQVRVPIKHTI